MFNKITLKVEMKKKHNFKNNLILKDNIKKKTKKV
jgi:hypothetical protein